MGPLVIDFKKKTFFISPGHHCDNLSMISMRTSINIGLRTIKNFCHIGSVSWSILYFVCIKLLVPLCYLDKCKHYFHPDFTIFSTFTHLCPISNLYLRTDLLSEQNLSTSITHSMPHSWFKNGCGARFCSQSINWNKLMNSKFIKQFQEIYVR